MQIAVIIGSHRIKSNSAKVGNFAAELLRASGETVDVISLAGNPLPFWDETLGSPDSVLAKQWQPYAARLRAAEGIVVVSPEWHGMVPSGLKNFLLLCSPKEVGHKAALIVTVSASLGGAYPVNELRTSGYKNNRLAFIPEHLIVRHAERVLNGPNPESDEDTYIRGRMRATLDLFREYARALAAMRLEHPFDFTAYPNGM